ncbi:hypothetical protein N333_11682 [Nestor notabilis]|uniref:Uncharacterized protein n=1 Tax=Nestor notabilis TaxID=176057 RepID=A0A091T810_NESNO|nr:hypothetical protein N333_11682 [Nestor notabilis]
MSRKTVVEFPQRLVVSSLGEENLTQPATEGGLRKEIVEEETSSSSSSDSDSSSDSEEENDSDDAKVAIKTKVEFPRRDSVFSENIAVKASMLAKENLSQKSHKEYVAKKQLQKTETPVKQVAFSKTSVSHETSKSKARDPKVKSAPKEADGQKLVLKPLLVESQDLTNVTHKSDYFEDKSIGTQVAAIQLKASSVTQEDIKQNLVSRGEEEKVKEAQESEAKVTAPRLEEETSESTVLVMGATAKEETIQEAGVQAGESSTIEAVGEPAPEELDNSTYKNLQHHEYNIYTFFDSVAVLSKFRQPQPSSGRPSPRH